MSATFQVRAFVLVLASAAAITTACASEDIVIATEKSNGNGDGDPDDDGKGDGKHAEGECSSADDCKDGANALCERASCKDPIGKCSTRPAVCDPMPAPVCGCDGITYWNDCLRRAFGITASTPGECPPGSAPCDPMLPPNDPKEPPPAGGATCPIGASCARLLPLGASCDKTMPKGTCWRLPARCPLEGNAGDGWVSCKDPKSTCASTCDAIRSEEPFARAATCP